MPMALAAVALVALAAAYVYSQSIGRPATVAELPAGDLPACAAGEIRTVAIDRASAARVIRKDPAYTQGLIFANDALYESTGQKGHSAIYRLDFASGEWSRLFVLDRDHFGEGLAKVGERFYQLTWQNRLAFAYTYDRNRQRLARVATFRHDGEGWGLTTLADELVLSDGSDELSFLDPATFAIKRTVPVRIGHLPLRNLNELESAGGVVLANIYGDSSIVGIEPASGCVGTVIDASRLVADVAPDLEKLSNPVCSSSCSKLDFVLNGIAYDPGQNELYVTGKNWPLIFVYRGLFRQ
jgi:glutaminyl-peptide cyclotransferase